MLRRAGNRRQIGSASNIDGNYIVRHPWPAGADDFPGNRIDADGRGVIQARAGESRQPAHVDMHVIEAVLPGDEARQHA